MVRVPGPATYIPPQNGALRKGRPHYDAPDPVDEHPLARVLVHLRPAVAAAAAAALAISRSSPGGYTPTVAAAVSPLAQQLLGCPGAQQQ